MKKIIIALCLILLVIPALYWYKCRQKIDLLKPVSLSAQAPFKYLQREDDIVLAQGKNDLLIDSFESDDKGVWKIWMRDKGKVRQGYDKEGKNNSRALLIESQSERDWSYLNTKLIEVKSGDIFGFEGNIKIDGDAACGIFGMILYGPDKQVIKWYYADERIKGVVHWEKISRRFLVPEGVKYIRFRLSGSGIGRIWFDDIRFYKEENTFKVPKNIKSQYLLENNILKYTLDLLSKKIIILDKRINKKWSAQIDLFDFMVLSANEQEGILKLEIINPEFLKRYKINVELVKNAAEIGYKIEQLDGTDFDSLDFPPVFLVSDKAEYVLPNSEGLIVETTRLHDNFGKPFRYGGGWPSPFLGVLDGNAGWMEIVETPNDFELTVSREGATLLSNRWIGQKGKFGYSRKIRYIFLDKPSYVEIAKRYRQYAKERGLLARLKEKEPIRKNNISKLVGAVDVWYWGPDKARFAQELTKAGIKKCLFSNVQERVDIEKINVLGYLSSRYDIYQDAWPPIYHEVTKINEGWPQDLVLDKKGEPISGWTIKKGLKEYPGGVICSVPGLERAKRLISKELIQKPYNARFIDTTTASMWKECYNPKHPTTRTDDIKYKMELLGLCSRDLGLVTGSEDGVEAAVPYADYFEGMMSPGIGRLPNSGREVRRVTYVAPTKNFLCYGAGEKYRIPLWQLVYGDCAVATWYWGDSSNRIPDVWWRKDLLNILYGNMPLWAIRDWAHWKQYKARFVESYNNVCPVFEKVGFLEMLSHRFVTEDRTVQETVFEGDIRVVVNFGEGTFKVINPEYNLPAHGFVVFDKDKIWKEGICH